MHTATGLVSTIAVTFIMVAGIAIMIGGSRGGAAVASGAARLGERAAIGIGRRLIDGLGWVIQHLIEFISRMYTALYNWGIGRGMARWLSGLVTVIVIAVVVLII